MMETPTGPVPALRLSLENTGTVRLDQIHVRTDTRRPDGHGTSGAVRVGPLAPGAVTTVTAPLSAVSHDDYECYAYTVEYLYDSGSGQLEQSGQTEGGTCA